MLVFPLSNTTGRARVEWSSPMHSVESGLTFRLKLVAVHLQTPESGDKADFCKIGCFQQRLLSAPSRQKASKRAVWENMDGCDRSRSTTLVC